MSNTLRNKIGSTVSLFSLLINLFPFQALPAHAATVDLGTPAIEAHHRPVETIVTAHQPITPAGADARAVLPGWFKSSVASEINTEHLAGLSLAVPEVVANAETADPNPALPAEDILPDWFAEKTESSATVPQPSDVSVLPGWFTENAGVDLGSQPAALSPLPDWFATTDGATVPEVEKSTLIPQTPAVPVLPNWFAEKENAGKPNAENLTLIPQAFAAPVLPGWFTGKNGAGSESQPPTLLLKPSDLSPLPDWFTQPAMPIAPQANPSPGLFFTIPGLDVVPEQPPGGVSAGNHFGDVYTITVSNNSALTAFDFIVAITMPRNGFTYTVGSVSMVSSVDGIVTLTEIYTPSTDQVKWIPNLILDMLPGEVITINFKMTTGPDAVSGQRLDVDVFYENPIGEPSVTNAGVNITVGRGNLVITKRPVIQNATFGDVVVWDVEIANTGLGDVYSATVYDVPGIGYTNVQNNFPVAPVSVMTIGQRINYLVTATVNSCTNLTNTAFAYWSIGNDEGNATAANPVSQDVDVIYNLSAPQVSASANSVNFEYCAIPTKTVAITYTNDPAAGAARDFVVTSDSPVNTLFNVISVAGGWNFDGTDTFTTADALLPGATKVLTFVLQPKTAVCGTDTNGQFNFTTNYNGACGFPYAGPPATVNYTFGQQAAPALSVNKTGSLAANNRDATFTVTLSVQNIEEISGNIVITDNVSTAFAAGVTFTPPANGSVVTSGNQLVWTIDSTGLSGNLTDQLVVNATALDSGLNTCSIFYNNAVTATADVDCPLCHAPLQSSDSVDLSPIIRRPALDMTVNQIEFDYCAATPQQVVLTVTNLITAGEAHAVTVDLLSAFNDSLPATQPYPGSLGSPSSPDVTVVPGSVSAGWTFNSGSNQFTYIGNGGVITPGTVVTLAFNVDPASVCGNYANRDLQFRLNSRDACNLAALPVLTQTDVISYDETNLPRLGISKSGPTGQPAPGDVFNFTVDFIARNAQNMSGSVRITDVMPQAFTVLAYTGTVTESVGNTTYSLTGTNTAPQGVPATIAGTTLGSGDTRLVWDVPLVGLLAAVTLTGKLVIQVRARPEIADQCGSSTNYTNNASGTVGDACPTCPGIGPVNASFNVTVRPSKVDSGAFPKSATSNAEVCGLLQVSNVYTHVFVTDWNNVVFTETMGTLGGSLSAGDLSYVTGTLSVIVNGTDVTSRVNFIQTAPLLKLGFGNVGLDVITGSRDITVAYNLYITNTLLGGAPAKTFNTRSQLSVSNIQSIGVCGTGDSYFFDQVATTTVRRADLQVNIEPATFVGCKPVPVTLTVSDSDLLAHSLVADNVVVTFSVGSPDFTSIDTNTVTYGGEFAGNPVTVTVGGNVITWAFQNPFTDPLRTNGTLTGTISFTMQRSCEAPPIAAGVQFDNACGVTYGNSGSNTSPVLAPDVRLFVTPDRYLLSTNQATWRIYAINTGNGVAGRTIITDVLGTGLQFISYTTNATSQVNLLTPLPVAPGQTVEWQVNDIQPGQVVQIDLTAVDAVSCVDLNSTVLLNSGCYNNSCGQVYSESIQFVRPITGVRSSNAQTADLGFCDNGEVILTVKNASPEAHIYDMVITETLTTLSYVPGSARITVTDRTGTPIAGLTNIALEPITATGTSITGSALMTLTWDLINSTDITTARTILADRAPEDSVNIRFTVEGDCDAPDQNNVVASAGGKEPCGNFFFRDEQAVTLNTIEPSISMVKEGRNVTNGFTQFSPVVYGEPGDVIVWRVTINNAATAFKAKNLVVEDTLPPNMDVAVPTASSAVGVITPTAGHVTWNIGDLPADGIDRILYITTTVNATDTDFCLITTTNQVVATYGCDAGCRANPITATADFRGRPELTLSMPSNTDISICGGLITVTLTTPAPVYSVTLTDTLPTGFAYGSLVRVTNNLTNNVSALTPTNIVTAGGGNIVIFSWNAVPAGTTNLVFRQVNSATSGTCSVNLGNQNQADVAYHANAVCTTTGTLTDSVKRTVTVNEPNVSVSIAPALTNVNGGDTISWTITVNNAGPGDADNLVVTDTLSPGFVSFGGGQGSFGETPSINIANKTVVWTLARSLVANEVWTATVTGTVPITGQTLDSSVDVRGSCTGGCDHTIISTTAHASLLAQFIKGPEVQTGTIGDVAVFTFTGFINGLDFNYDDLTLTDTLPAGLGYLAATLVYTTDSDGSDAGPARVGPVAPTTAPASRQPGNVIWQVGSVSGTVAFSGIITTVISDTTVNIDGVRQTNQITLTYREAGNATTFTFTDTANVDVVEPVLHIGKSYVTPPGCQAVLLKDNFNTNTFDTAKWNNIGGPIQVSQGVLNLLDFSDMEHTGQQFSDFDLSFMIQKDLNTTFRVIFRASTTGSNAWRDAYWLEWDSGANRLRLRGRRNNSDFILQSANLSAFDNGQWHHVELNASDFRLQAYVDGVKLLDTVDPNQYFAAGYLQFQLPGSGSDVKLDDILVTRLGQTGCTVGANDLVTYTLTISNQSAIPGHNLVITDNIPAGMSLVTYTLISDGGSSTFTGPAAGATDLLTWTMEYLTPTTPFTSLNHTVITLSVVLQVADAISANVILENQASLAYDGQAGNGPVGVQRDYSGGSHSTAVRTVDGTISKTRVFSPPPTATLGTLVTYTLIVPASPITATLYNVIITDQLNLPRFFIENVTTGGGTGGAASFNAATGLITATFASVPHNTQATVTVTTRISHEYPLPATDPNSGDVVTNSAVFTHATANRNTITRSNVVTTNIGEPLLTVSKVARANTGSVNDLLETSRLTYTIRVTNIGNSPAYSVVITDAIPAGISVTQLLTGAASAVGGPVVGPGILTWTLDVISNTAPANVIELGYAAVLSGVVSGQSLTNTVIVYNTSLTDTIPGVRPYVTTTSEIVTLRQLLALGNQVWYDANDNGRIDAGETGFTGVDVELYRDTNGDGVYTPGTDQFISNTTTIAGGYYTFTKLSPGGYLVVITSTNFTGTGVLRNYITSTDVVTGNSDLDNWNHGVRTGVLGNGGYAASSVVTLTVNSEPHDGGNANYTIDFGFLLADLGDLPDSFGTTLGNSGPRHVISPTLYLGARVDAESDGQPSVGANGDDTNATTNFVGSSGDDEDGVSWTPLVLGQVTTFSITATGTGGYLNAWVDWNANGTFDTGEHVFTGNLLSNGANTLTTTVPATATITGTVYLRFRFSTSSTLSFTGPAPDGEVEDYVDTTTVAYDLGDLPDGYGTTLANSGPRHRISPTLYLGSRVDAEGDGQPSANALGDDANATSSVGAPPGDDEDGVSWTTLVAGQVSTFTITASVNGGFLNGWIDWNANGAFDAGEQVFTGTSLTAGSNTFPITVPLSASISNNIYLRFRYSTSSTLSPTGDAPDGEVEDYVDRIIAYDLGDLPDGYGTLLGNNGPRHVISPALYLGSRVDAEPDGQPSVGANSDDITQTTAYGAGGVGDDEDGVSWTTLVAGQVSTFTITASVNGGFLNGWIDWNANGAFDAGEQVFTGTSLAAGSNTFPITVPVTAVYTDNIYLRFRYSTSSTLSPTGPAPDGEVEDYVGRVIVYDFGDLPDSYGTLLGSNGPRHVISPTNNPTLGADVDNEANGFPTPTATGDDTNRRDDEDGVRLDSSIVAGQVATFTVTGTNVTGARLNVWMDWNGDGDFNDAGERVFTNTTLIAGSQQITVAVPNVTISSTVNTRWRYSTDTAGSGSPTGAAANGEIEDHQYPTVVYDFGDLPDSSVNGGVTPGGYATHTYPTRLTDNGARHVILPNNNPTLGGRVDAEPDGQPNTPATGDDTATSTVGIGPLPADDEDGVGFPNGRVLIPGELLTLTVSALNVAGGGADGRLSAWIDFNGNGQLELSERITVGQFITAGATITFAVRVPTSTRQGITTYMRFRFSGVGQTITQPTGAAQAGEVEDYAIPVRELDWGDLPDSSSGTYTYPTRYADNGPRHVLDGTYLGARVDAETDGVPSVGADGDDLNNTPDDEDGIVFLTPVVPGRTATIQVTAGTTGYLNSWFDFDGDGNLDTFTITNIDGAPVTRQSNSDIFFNTTGVHTFTFTVPNSGPVTSLYSRFRYTTNPGEANSPVGLAPTGEVEDYVLLSLGDLVWRDDGSGAAYNNGQYEPLSGETPISNVVLILLNSSGITVTDAAGNAITTTTGTNGRYLFPGLPPGNYRVKVAPSNFRAGGNLEGLLSSSDAGGTAANPNNNVDEELDENGADNPNPESNGITSGIITLAPNSEPSAKDGDTNSNPTLDFGFVPLLSLGNFVWFDSNDSGTWNAGEPGIPGVTVELYRDTNGDGVYTPGTDQFVTNTTTLPGGIYTFTNLNPGGYVVVITSTNFTGTGALRDYITSTTAVTGNSDLNNTNHGYRSGSLGNGGYAAGTVITLTPGLEPDDAGRANYTIDFGFIRADLGDLPDSYGTSLGANGPYHVILPSNNPTLGADVDAESDGPPTADATGDDVTNRDDEDGVRLDSPLAGGQVATFTVTGTNVTGARLNVWMDWNGDGDFNDAGERVFTNTTLNTGSQQLTVTVPGAISSTVNTRWRYSTDTSGSSSPTGRAANGEVEDHQYPTTVYDFGDLPDNYGTTLGNNGARHRILPSGNPTLGGDVDDELNGLPTTGATGDDTDNRDDEDGVRLDTPLVPGAVATFTITGTNVTGARLNVWMDWNGDGDFNDAGERVFTNATLANGAQQITVTVPAIALSSTINTRWRYSTDTAGSGSPTGEATNGEVEDHQFTPPPMDLGDLPDSSIGAFSYPTRLADNGARHVIVPGNNPTLGRGVDSETNGQPSTTATGDDANATTWYGAAPAGTDDEDGVVWSRLVPGQAASVTVSALAAANGGRSGFLNAWIDFNGDGDFNDAGEQIALDRAIAAGGSATVNFTVPSTAASTLYSRFRFSSAGGDTPTGVALDGEVEDYVQSTGTTDFGDLPDGPYSTRLANNGPRHFIDGTFLGSIVDAESDGFPSNGATGDDIDNLDDEDGVVFLTPIVSGQPAQIRVTAGTTGYLNSWFDFDGDGNLDVYNITNINGTAVVSPSNTDIFFSATGDYTLTFTVPNVTISSSLYSRFRYTTNPGQANTPTGFAPSGEVEDYVLLSLGDLVWRDDGAGGGTRDNGIRDGGEQGIPNVELVLRDRNGITVTDGAGNPVTTTTDANGRYLFPGLPPGDYTVFIPPSEFGSGGPLANHRSSSPNVTNPNNNLDEDQDENGLNNNNPPANGITSGIITLTPGDEPAGNGNSNLTLDFGMLTPQPAILVTKDVTVSPNVLSATVTFTLRITNTGDITYTSMLVTDTMPPGFTYAGNANIAPVAAPTGRVVVWNIPGPVAPNDVVEIRFESRIDTGITGIFTNVVTGTGIFTGGTVSDDDTAPVVVTDPALVINKQRVAGVTNGLITFTITISNVGPSTLTTVPLFDNYVGPVQYVGGTPQANPPVITNSTGGEVRWFDLTAAGPNGFGRNLPPGDAFVVTTVYSLTTTEMSFSMVNTATVSGALDVFTNRANDDQDRVILVNEPTAVDLLYFTGSNQAGGVLLAWATAAEVDNFAFRLLRSKTGQLADAVDVAFIPADGKGNGLNATYEYLDADVTAAETYTYWLVDIDTAGTETLHGPVTVAFDGGINSTSEQIYLPLIFKKHNLE